jgi:hypothetical protein
MCAKMDLKGREGIFITPQHLGMIQHELAVPVTRFGQLFRPMQPADRPMHAQSQVGRMRVPLGALAGFELVVVHCGMRFFMVEP